MLVVVNSLLPHLYSQFSYGADLCHGCHGSNNDVKAEASRLCLISFHIHCTAEFEIEGCEASITVSRISDFPVRACNGFWCRLTSEKKHLSVSSFLSWNIEMLSFQPVQLHISYIFFRSGGGLCKIWEKEVKDSEEIDQNHIWLIKL